MRTYTTRLSKTDRRTHKHTHIHTSTYTRIHTLTHAFSFFFKTLNKRICISTMCCVGHNAPHNPIYKTETHFGVKHHHQLHKTGRKGKKKKRLESPESNGDIGRSQCYFIIITFRQFSPFLFLFSTLSYATDDDVLHRNVFPSCK